MRHPYPSGFCFLTVSTIDRYNTCKPFLESGTDTTDKLFTHIFSEQVRINNILKKNVKMIFLSKQQFKKYTECQNCPSCNVTLTSLNKVKNHCHVSGNYILPLCNLRMKFKKDLGPMLLMVRSILSLSFFTTSKAMMVISSSRISPNFIPQRT